MKIARINPRFTGFHIVSEFITTFAALFGMFAHGGITSITIFPFVFYSNKYVKRNIITKHKQKIFIQQQMECGMAGVLIYFILGLLLKSWLVSLPVIFLWLIIYAVNYVANLFRFPKSYRTLVAFNREANRFANILHYTILRRPFAWIPLLRF